MKRVPRSTAVLLVLGLSTSALAFQGSSQFQRPPLPNLFQSSDDNLDAGPVDARIATLQPTFRWKGAEANATVSVMDAKGKEIWKGNAQPSMVRPAVKLSPAAKLS